MFVINLFNRKGKKSSDGFYLQLDESATAKPEAAAPASEPVAKAAEPAATNGNGKAPAPAPAAKSEAPAPEAKKKAPAPKAKSKEPAAETAPAPAAKSEVPAKPAAAAQSEITFAEYNTISVPQFGSRRRPGANMEYFLELARQVQR